MLAFGIATAAQAQGSMAMDAPGKKDAPKDSMAMSGMMMAKPKHDAKKHDSMKKDAAKSNSMMAPSH
jgi:hypothetical protein